MFAEYIYNKANMEYSNRLLVIDKDDMWNKSKIADCLTEKGFTIIKYIDDIHFRAEHNEVIYGTESKIIVLVTKECYIPYDIQKRFGVYFLSYQNLFPKLNTSVLLTYPSLDFELLTAAYKNLFVDLLSTEDTHSFIESRVYEKDNVHKLLLSLADEINEKAEKAATYHDWFIIANKKAYFDELAIKYDIIVSTETVQFKFLQYVLEQYGKLSSIIDPDSPVLVSRVMEFINDRSRKFVVIVMDGMSEFDWNIISKSFTDIQYKKSDVYAMIPTTTSISRQCLLSGKFPSQLISPWTQSKEKNEFVDGAVNLGFELSQIEYLRGYDASFSAFTKCGAVIINDIDDMVHGQRQGRVGMHNDVSVLAKQHKLHDLVARLMQAGFDVYITADHGNTPCNGIGKIVKAGVEVETKSHRMMVLKDFADKQGIISRYGMIDYPKYYLNKEYDYLICGIGTSLDSKGDVVMSHGGISLDEVIIPFIQIKAEENNG